MKLGRLIAIGNISIDMNNKKCWLKANYIYRGAQARGGFAQKYPQSYENLDAIATHEKEVAKSRARAEGYRDKSNFLAEKHTRWAAQMEKAQKRSQ